jgi:hypothetical protein
MTGEARGEGIFGKKEKMEGVVGPAGPKGGGRGRAAGPPGRPTAGEGGGWAKRGEGGEREKEKAFLFLISTFSI